MPDRRRTPLPEGMRGLQEFGRRIGWGTGDAAARTRAKEITAEELREMAMTSELASMWGAFYEAELVRNPANPSARGRVELMARIIELLEE